MTSAAGQAGQNQASNIYNAGQARASGYVGGANALSGALQGIGSMAAQYPLYQAQTNYMNNMANNAQMGRMAALTPSAYSAISQNQDIF
jgi:hypothetical protein